MRRTNKYNKSYYFIYYAIDQNRILEKSWISKNLLNTYIKAKARPDYDKHIFVTAADVSEENEEKIFKHSNFVEKFENNQSVVYVFKVPNEYLDDLEKFKEGKYTQFSRQYKKLLSSIYPSEVRDSYIDSKGVEHIYMRPHKVFQSVFPTKASRLQLAENLGVELGRELEIDCEITSKPDLDDETLDF